MVIHSIRKSVSILSNHDAEERPPARVIPLNTKSRTHAKAQGQIKAKNQAQKNKHHKATLTLTDRIAWAIQIAAMVFAGYLIVRGCGKLG